MARATQLAQACQPKSSRRTLAGKGNPGRATGQNAPARRMVGQSDLTPVSGLFSTLGPRTCLYRGRAARCRRIKKVKNPTTSNMSYLSKLSARLAMRPPYTVLASVAAAAFLLAGCSDQSVTEPVPSAAENPAILTATQETLLAQGLLRTVPLSAPVVVVKTLSSGGGGITVPGTDFQLQVPNGAFAGKSLTFTITALAGNVVAYDFQPHGYKFLKPLRFVQQLGHTNWKDLKLPAGFQPGWNGAYFADQSQIDLLTGTAVVNELLPANVNVSGATLTFPIPHFSGYMVSSGRR